MSVEIRWKGKMAFEGIPPSGHSVLMDASQSVGGEDRGPKPMEVFLLSLGGCTAMDVISILNKMKQEVTDFKIEIESERASEHPKVYTYVKLTYIIEGRNLSPQLVNKAVNLSQNKYCSVSAMLKKTAKLEYEVVIKEV